MRKHRNNAEDINDKLITNLRDLSHTMRFLYEGKGSQKRILIILNELGAITQRALTERLGIQPGSVSEVLTKLENARLITRSSSAADRRTANIMLTEKGEKLAVEMTKQRNKRHDEMFSCLLEDEKSTLLSLLEKINADWKQHYENIEKNHKHCQHHNHYIKANHFEQGE